jgi:hypothetical protein
VIMGAACPALTFALLSSPASLGVPFFLVRWLGLVLVLYLFVFGLALRLAAALVRKGLHLHTPG